jgi:hypothetical protein
VRVTINGMQLISTMGVSRLERELEGGKNFSRALREHFGIEMPGEGGDEGTHGR